MTYAAAHRARVMLLYRRALKTVLDWSGDRRQWYGRARAVRSEFEANRVTVRRLKPFAGADAASPPRPRTPEREREEAGIRRRRSVALLTPPSLNNTTTKPIKTL
jgi:hypothetical protein